MAEGLNPTKADFAAMVQRALAKYDQFPAGGVEYAARRVATDAGLRGWGELAAAVNEAKVYREG